MLSRKEVTDRLDEIGKELFKKFEPELHTKIGKRNQRKAEELENHVIEGINDALSHLPENPDLELVNKIGYEWINRSVSYYINEPLVYSLVRKFDNLPIPEEDRLSAAQKGFVTALNLFEPDRGFQFSTFAYRLMMNEIIALEKDRKKQGIITHPSRIILAPKDLKVVRIEKSVGHRIIRIGKEVVDLFNVSVIHDGSNSEYTYHYLYFLSKKVKVGALIKQGDELGTLAGAEVEVGSVEGHLESEANGDAIFINPVDNKSEGFRRPDSQLSRDLTLSILSECLLELNDNERFILEKRVLASRSNTVSIVEAAKILKIASSEVKLLEDRILLKLRRMMEEKGVDAKDLKAFY
mgnify:CR=1 FL=1